MKKAKQVTKGMSPEQQAFVEQLLTKLRQEQQMRLQSEEQNEQVMSRMVLTQKQLEQQIRNLTGKGKPVSTISGTNMHATTAGGLSSNQITPIESEENTMLQDE